MPDAVELRVRLIVLLGVIDNGDGDGVPEALAGATELLPVRLLVEDTNVEGVKDSLCADEGLAIGLVVVDTLDVLGVLGVTDDEAPATDDEPVELLVEVGDTLRVRDPVTDAALVVVIVTLALMDTLVEAEGENVLEGVCDAATRDGDPVMDRVMEADSDMVFDMDGVKVVEAVSEELGVEDTAVLAVADGERLGEAARGLGYATGH